MSDERPCECIRLGYPEQDCPTHGEIASLRADVERLDAEVEEDERRLMASKDKIERLTAALDEARASLDGALRERDEAREVRDAAVDEARSLRSSLVRVTEERDAAREEIRTTLLADEERRKLTGDALHAESEVARLRAEKDGAYAERNQVVALLARMSVANGWRAGLRSHEPDPDPAWDADWRNVVAIDLPTGQVTWHYHDSDRPLFATLPPYTGSWDGHDTPEKYRRVNSALRAPEAKP